MMPFICYIVVIVGSMAISITAYTLVMLGWCGPGAAAVARLPHPSSAEPSERKSLSLDLYLAFTFEYKKRNGEKVEAGPESESCVLCLSSFKDGESVCQLPRCKHSFHAPCIDMWLYSHSDCPVCRAPVDRMTPQNRAKSTPENSGEVVLDIRA